MLARSAEQRGVRDCKLYCLTSAELGPGALGRERERGLNVLLITFPAFILSCLSN